MRSDMTQHIPTAERSSTPQHAPDPWLTEAIARQKAAEPIPERVPTDVELVAWYRQFGSRYDYKTRLTPSDRKRLIRWHNAVTKPRSEWKPVDAAKFWSTSIDLLDLRVWGSIHIGKTTKVFRSLHLECGISLDQIGSIIDDYLVEPRLSRLQTIPKISQDFMKYLGKRLGHQIPPTHAQMLNRTGYW